MSTITTTHRAQAEHLAVDSRGHGRLELEGYVAFAPKIDGWKPFFVARYGFDRTVFTYRKEESPCPT